MSNDAPKKRSKFKYSNKFLEDTARHLTKTQVAMWMTLWNYAMSTKDGVLEVEMSITDVGELLGMRRHHASRDRSKLIEMGLLRPAGVGGNRVKRFELYPLRKDQEPPDGRSQ